MKGCGPCGPLAKVIYVHVLTWGGQCAHRVGGRPFWATSGVKCLAFQSSNANELIWLRNKAGR